MFAVRPARSALRGHTWRWACAVLALLLPCVAARAQEPVVAAALPQTPAPVAGSVTGTVVDVDGDIVPGALVRLTSAVTQLSTETASEPDGSFHFTNVPAGKFTLSVLARGFAEVKSEGTLLPGRTLELEPVKLTTPTAEFSVEALSSFQIAEVELAHEEHQRLLGVIPNFGIAYDWDAPAMSTGQKYRLATRFVFDPFNLAYAGAQAGIEQATGTFGGYGPGWAGFGSRYGAAVGDLLIANELGGAVFPSLFHQDPRYFWKGTGTWRQRAVYAMSRAVICRGDNGHSQFNVSGVAASLTAGAVANLYYPAENHGDITLTFENAGLGLAADAIGNVVQEFFFKKLTPNSSKLPPNTTGMAGAVLTDEAKQRLPIISRRSLKHQHH